MWVLVVLSIGSIGNLNTMVTAEFETKQGCEQAAKWFNQRQNINAICVEDKKHDDSY